MVSSSLRSLRAFWPGRRRDGHGRIGRLRPRTRRESEEIGAIQRQIENPRKAASTRLPAKSKPSAQEAESISARLVSDRQWHPGPRTRHHLGRTADCRTECRRRQDHRRSRRQGGRPVGIAGRSAAARAQSTAGPGCRTRRHSARPARRDAARNRRSGTAAGGDRSLPNSSTGLRNGAHRNRSRTRRVFARILPA